MGKIRKQENGLNSKYRKINKWENGLKWINWEK